MDGDSSDKIFSTLKGTRKRKYVINDQEKILVPVLEKLSVDELTEISAYSKFMRCMQLILENVDQSRIAKFVKDNQLIVQENLLINHSHLQDLCRESAKLKFIGDMKTISVDRLIQLLNVLEINIRGADNISFTTVLKEDDSGSDMKLIRVMGAVDASLCCLYIMTSPNMPKRIYVEDCINRIIVFIKYQLYNSIFPHYDSVHQTNSNKISRKKSLNLQPCSEQMSTLYSKIYELINLLPELLNIQTLVDTTVLNLSSVCLPTLFCENITELQLSCLKLITTIFTVYEKHRKLLLDDILESVTNVPNSKQKSYQLSTTEQIHMLTAIVLQLVQCTTTLPENLVNPNKKALKQIDNDTLICNKYEQIFKIAGTFLTVFLNKCSNKNEEMVYRPILDIFLRDLLLMVNKPEWPAAELLLNLFANLLAKNLSNKDMDITWRGISLDYLGLITAKLKKHIILSLSNIDIINQLIKKIKLDEENDEIDDKQNLDDEEEKMKILHCVLLDYLAVNSHKEEIYKYARYFYIVQWYKDATQKKTLVTTATGDTNKKSNSKKSNKKNADLGMYGMIEERKKMYIDKIQALQEQTCIGQSSAEIISQYLMSKNSFSQSFDGYLRTILLVLRESSNTIRTKAIKCLAMIVEVDPLVLGNKDMQIAVHHSFLDHSAAVREASVDLVGKFALNQPELIDKYYDMLSTRILDTSVSVRKRVIKIFRDICLEYPEFPKISEICIKIIRRVNDEDGINKLVIEIFQNMWFTPISKCSTDEATLLKKVINITNVIASLKEIGLDWFEELLVQMFVPKENKVDSTKTEPPKTILFACQQIVDCLMENIIHLKESNTINSKGGCCEQIGTYMTTLNLFAKIKPALLVKHAITLQPLLTLKGDDKIINSIACILELVVPLMEQPDKTFLAQLEQDFVKLIIKHDRTAISSCIACLSSIVNVTKNFKLIRDCFNQYYDYVNKFKYFVQIDTESCKNIVINCKPTFKRTLFIIGLLLRHFDFTDKNVIEGLPVNIKNQVLDVFLYFLRHKDEDIQSNTLKAIGFICIRYYDFLMNNELKKFYHEILTKTDVSLKMKSDVLQNIEMYLREQDNRINKNRECENQADLKEIGDIGSIITQFYMKPILVSYLHAHIGVRHAFLKVIKLILRQGLVHSEHIVPYLICMSTDSDKVLANNADTELLEIQKMYPGFIHTKSQLGVQLSYQLQTLLQEGIIRGSKITEQEYPSALNGYLYSLFRTSKQQRRTLALNMLKQFDEQHTNLPYLLYLADNLAYFPYSVQDEPLFIIHHINIMISLTGTNFLQSFKEGLTDSKNYVDALDDEEEEEDVLIAKLPENTTDFQGWITAAQGCLLLLLLKEYLKDIYGLNDRKISQYSPSEVTKIYEKSVTRRKNTVFNPKNIINRMKQGPPKEILDASGRKKLIAEYLNFKNLMLKLDLKDSSDDTKC